MAKTFLQLTTPAATYPVSVSDVKANARIDASDEDALITDYIAAATRSVEEMSGRTLLAQTWRIQTYGLTGRVYLELPKTPVQSISAVSYQDGDDATQAMSTSDFYLFSDDYKAWVQPKDGIMWPSTFDRPDAVSVSFVAGYASASDIPQGLKHAIIMLATHWYEYRQPIVQSTVANIPFAIEHLVGLDKTGWIGA